MWHTYITPSSIDQVLENLAIFREKARLVAGATDLLLEIERDQRKGIEVLIDISRLPGQDQIALDEGNQIHLGPLVTHNHCVDSKLIREYAIPLAQAALEVGSPQIRNRGTIAGNLITASPANDTITPLMALGAKVTLRSRSGTREVPLIDFYTGVRRTVMHPEEMMVDIAFPAMMPNKRGVYIKFALRRAQAISVVNAAIVIEFDNRQVKSASITLGSVAPTIINAKMAEEFLINKQLDDKTIENVANLAAEAAKPIDDIRSSAGYRRAMTRVIISRGLKKIANHTEKEGLPSDPVLLWGKPVKTWPGNEEDTIHDNHTPIITTINGKKYEFLSGQRKTLLHLIREEGGLIGSKEGCSEGECGACTIFLDGKAVMGCLVPAPRAHGAVIITVEGLKVGEKLNRVQEAFVSEGAVQCGYCTPGFLMSATKLFEEKSKPSGDEIRQSITGNLCRCTGYYNIIKAIEQAAQKGV